MRWASALTGIRKLTVCTIFASGSDVDHFYAPSHELDLESIRQLVFTLLSDCLFSPQCVQRAPHLSNDVFYLTACYVTIKENKSIINGKSCEYLKNCLQYANNQTKLKTYPNICEYLTNNNTMLISLRSLSFDKGNYRRRDAWCILDQKIMLITKLKPIIESQCTFIDLTTSAASTHLPHTCAICTFRVALCQ